jgi:hypothetical protein
VCRSEAEHQTLLELLSDSARDRFSHRIHLWPRYFFNQHLFVRSVRYERRRTKYEFEIQWNYTLDTRHQNYQVRFTFDSHAEGYRSLSEQKLLCMLSGKDSIIPFIPPSLPEPFTVTISFLDDLETPHLAFRQTYNSDDLPF